MGIEIGGGIDIGGGITISPGPASLRSLLSGTGQTAYDAAATDSWFAVSSTDYANVQAGLTGVSNIGMTNALIAAATNPFSQNFGATLDQPNATVPVGNYILGVVSKTAVGGSGPTTFRPISSTTFRGTYANIGTGSLSMNASITAFYWLCKNPSAAVSSTTYVALGVPVGGSGRSWASSANTGGTTWGSGATGGAYNSSLSTWTTFTSSLPVQQWLLTNVQQW